MRALFVIFDRPYNGMGRETSGRYGPYDQVSFNGTQLHATRNGIPSVVATCHSVNDRPYFSCPDGPFKNFTITDFEVEGS